MGRLFEAVKLGKHTLQNRIVVPPMVCFTFAGEDGYAVDLNTEHYRALAKGGFGLIIQEATCVSPHGKLTSTQLGLWEDGQIAGHKKIVDAVHREGGVFLVQIHHAGIMGVSPPLDCPSDFSFTRPDGQPATGHEMPREKVKEVIGQFVAACVRAQKAGYDGVELHGCHNYLISQFFNREVNRRGDEYGQPERFALEILSAVREAVEDSFIVGMRLGVFEPTLADGICHAKLLAEAGADFLNISRGFASCSQPEKPEGYPYWDIIYGAQRIKEAVNIPVFAVGGINSPQMAREVLETTGVDMVNIGRCALVNPNWGRDAKEGWDTGRCLYCKTCAWRGDYTKCPGRILYNKGAENPVYV